MLKRMWREDEGVLTFEWILLTTLLVIGIVGAISGVRDAISVELGNVAGAMVSLDQSYSVGSPIQVGAGGVCPAVSCCFKGAVGMGFQATPRSYGASRTDGTTPVPATKCCS